MAMTDCQYQENLTASRLPLSNRLLKDFIQHYSTIAYPVTNLSIKKAFHWCESAEQAFHNLKHVMTTASVLGLPDFSHSFKWRQMLILPEMVLFISIGPPYCSFSKKLNTGCEQIQFMSIKM